MVEVVAAAIAYAVPASAATIGATSLTYATVAATAVIAGTSITATILLTDTPKAQFNGQQIAVKQPRPPRIMGYGTAKIGGTYVFLEADVDQRLYEVFYHAEGEIEDYLEWWLGDTLLDLSPGSNGGTPTVGPGTHEGENLLRIKSYKGTDDQVADGWLTAAFSEWTADHTLTGLAYSVIEADLPDRKTKERFALFYPQGAPVLRVVVKMAKVYNPLTGGIVWTDLAGPIIRDYLTSERGFAIPEAMIDDDSFLAFSELCDELVQLKRPDDWVVDDPDTFEPRYRIGGAFKLTDEPRSVLREMLAACDGELYITGEGKVAIRGGKWEEPTVTLTDDHIISYSYEAGQDKLSAFNELKLTYTSPLHDYQPTETEAWSDFVNQEERGEVLTQDLTLAFVQFHGQARRLGKIAMHKANPRHKLHLVTNMAGLDALGQGTVRVQFEELGLYVTCLVTSFEFDIASQTCSIGLSSMTEAAYDWAQESEEGTAPTVPEDTDQGGSVPGDSEAPDPVISPALSVDAGDVVLDWTTPDNANFYATRIYRGLAPAFNLATLLTTKFSSPGSSRTHRDVGPPDSAYYWLVAINSSGLESTPNTMLVHGAAEDFTTGWTGTATVTTVAAGGPGSVDAYDIEDNAGSFESRVRNSETIPADSATHTVTFAIQKGVGLAEIRCDVNMTGGTAQNRIARMNPDTGAVVANCTVISLDATWWWVTITTAANNGTNTGLAVTFYPAGAAGAGTAIQRVAAFTVA